MRYLFLLLATLFAATAAGLQQSQSAPDVDGIVATLEDESGVIAFAVAPGSGGSLTSPFYPAGNLEPIVQSFDGTPILESWWQRGTQTIKMEVWMLPTEDETTHVVRQDQLFATMEANGWTNVLPPSSTAISGGGGGSSSQTLESKFEKNTYDDNGTRTSTRTCTLKTPRKPGESALKHIGRHEEEMRALETAGWINVPEWTPPPGSGS